MKRTVAVLLAVPLALAAGCARDDLEGKVIAKDVDPGYSYVQMQPITSTSCSGNPSVCRTTTTGYYPITFTVPDCWQISVEGATSGQTCVDKSRWETIEIGDDYVGADVDPKDRQEKSRD